MGAGHAVAGLGARWQRWLAPQPTLAAEPPPRQAVLETITPMIAPDTEPDSGGGPGGRRLQQPGAPDRRLALEAHDRRHGRTSRATTGNGCKAHAIAPYDLQEFPSVQVQ